MQHPRFLETCLTQLRARAPGLEVIRGDRYHPILAVRLPRVQLPTSFPVASTSVTVALPRCAGWLPDATIAGVFTAERLRVEFEGELGTLPFCDPVDASWIEKTARFYPLLEQRPELVAGRSFICLDSEHLRALTPHQALILLGQYLRTWRARCFDLAVRHGAVVRGEASGDVRESQSWLDHLVAQVAPRLKTALLAAAQTGRAPGASLVAGLEPLAEPEEPEPGPMR